MNTEGASVSVTGGITVPHPMPHYSRTNDDAFSDNA
jgi:hypothetical protein